jgi:hypothetical protein
MISVVVEKGVCRAAFCVKTLLFLLVFFVERVAKGNLYFSSVMKFLTKRLERELMLVAFSAPFVGNCFHSK